MRYCSRACQQATYRDRHARPVAEVRREAEAILHTLALRAGGTGVDAIDDDKLSALIRSVRAVLDLLPESGVLAHVAETMPEVPVPVAAPVAAAFVEPGALVDVDAATAVVEPLVDDVLEEQESVTPEPVRETPPPVRAARRGGHRPTDQQAAIMDAFATGKNLVVEAGAGTGKTSTLVLAASEMPSTRRGVYVAFNKSVQVEAKAKFPANVLCTTAHGLAYRALGRLYADRLNGPRVPGREVARIMQITAALDLTTSAGQRVLDPAVLAGIAAGTVERYCRSADLVIGPGHVPTVNGVDGPAKDVLRDYVVPVAEAMWQELHGKRGRLRFAHDHYLKMWALTEPDLRTDVVMFDEAQDASPVIAKVVQAQQSQLIAVGDSNQAIYGWRGAIDALENWPAQVRLPLTQSWRFGPAIADEANKWLAVLESPLRLTGAPGVQSSVAVLTAPDAILCRTNAEAMGQAMGAMESGRRVALVGGGTGIKDMAMAAADLQAGRSTQHPELAAFKTWGEVQQYVEQDEAASDLAVFVRLVDDHGADELIRATRQLVTEATAQLTVSTAHKAKGREWKRVAIGNDFREPKVDDDGNRGRVARTDAMLAYVSVTRAQHILDRGGLSWIDDHTAGVKRPSPRRSSRMTDDAAAFWN